MHVLLSSLISCADGCACVTLLQPHFRQACGMTAARGTQCMTGRFAEELQVQQCAVLFKTGLHRALTCRVSAQDKQPDHGSYEMCWINPKFVGSGQHRVPDRNHRVQRHKTCCMRICSTAST